MTSTTTRNILLLGAVVMTAALGGCAATSAPAGSATPTDPPVTSSASPSPSTSPSDEPTLDLNDPASWIVTENSIGPVQLGEPFSQAREAVPTWTVDETCSWAAFWNAPDHSLTAYFVHDSAEQDGEVTTIDVAALVPLAPSDGPRTSDVLGFGSTRAEVLAAHPDAEEQTSTIGEAEMLRVDGAGEGSLFFTFAEDRDAVSAITLTLLDEPPYEVCG